MNYKKFAPRFFLFLFTGCLATGVVFLGFYENPALAPKEPTHAVVNNGPISLSNENSDDKDRAQSGSSQLINTPIYNSTPQLPFSDFSAPQRPKTTVINNQEQPVRIYTPQLVPNDPLASQWWESNSRLREAWDIPPGNNPTLLAIIDTGFGLNHEEFNNRWYSNSGESGSTVAQQPSTLNCTDRGLAVSASCNLIDDNGDAVVDNETGAANYQNPSRLNCTDQSKPITRDCNRVDDDGNGYIDDYRGWDFINFDNSAQAGELNPGGTGIWHGTAVAGVAAATGNNSKGIAGADWNTKILPIQALDDDSYGDTLSVGRAILYAAAQGADVISLSLGSDLPDDYVRQAVETATASGSVVVAASGNGGCGCMVYPANYPEVVAVGALGTDNQPASFSSWGSNLDILAPGTQFTAPSWSAAQPTNAYVSGINGTSFATPLISGVLTRLAGRQPTATPLQLIAALTENVNRLGLPVTTPHDSKLGYGKLDSFKALQRMVSAQSSSQSYGFNPVSKGDFYRFSRSEVVNSQVVQACENGAVGTTPLYEFYKAGSTFFSISKIELRKAQNAGYATGTTMGSACLQQPHDTPGSVRAINLFKEFRNLDKAVQ
ncbi:S8 family serine peptidase [Candidatus Saccharibacteria bacterium]|nr:S8 family serine peptidase [Candidatus Saccharibacteria bacterium]